MHVVEDSDQSPATTAAAHSERQPGTTRKALVLWGMHRSGTSALSRVLNLLGAALPSDLMRPQPDNPAGFWESTAVARFNDRLLQSVGRQWHDPRPLPADAWGAEAEAAISAASALVAEKWPADGPIVVKDPRLSRLGAIWLPALERAGFEPLTLLALRHPGAVAASLAVRNGFAPAHSRLLWLTYTLEAWAHQGVPRAVVSYDRLLSDWRATVAEAARSIGLELKPAGEAAEAIDAFLSPDLRHHQETVENGADDADLANRVYEGLAAAAGSVPCFSHETAVHRQMWQLFSGLWNSAAMTTKPMQAGAADTGRKRPEQAGPAKGAAGSVAVSEYLKNGFRNIEGWCVPHLWQAIEPLNDLQQEMGLRQPVAEIGVFHGKFLIGLVKTAMSPRGNYAIDVYDMQQFNLDGAGKGDLDALQRNLAANGLDGGAIEIMRADSMAMGDEEIAAIQRNAGAFGFFSVDGCHLPEHTINDVRIAMRLTAPEGIIFVDDYYNAHWPGVQEGIAKLYLTDTPKFVPLLFTCNKLFLCHLSFHERYLQHVEKHVRSHFPATRLKKVARFGYETLTLVPDLGSSDYVARELG